MPTEPVARFRRCRDAGAPPRPRRDARACRAVGLASPAGSWSMRIGWISAAFERSTALGAAGRGRGRGRRRGRGRHHRARTDQPVPLKSVEAIRQRLADRRATCAAARRAQGASPRCSPWCRASATSDRRDRGLPAAGAGASHRRAADRDPVAHGDEAARPPRRGACAHRRACAPSASPRSARPR